VSAGTLSVPPAAALTSLPSLRFLFIHMKSPRLLVTALLGAFLSTGSLHAAAATEPAFERAADGIVVHLDQGWLKLQPRTDSIVRVAYAPDRAFFDRPSLIVVPATGPAPTWDATSSDREVILKLGRVQAQIDRKTGAVTFLDASGQKILAERPGTRKLEPAFVQGESTFHLEQQWEPAHDEALYGLGQHQLGAVDIKDYDVDLWQHNGTVVVPFLVSTRGYGILWDNASYSRFGDLRPWTPLGDALTDTEGKAGGVTATYFGDGTFTHALFRHHVSDIALHVPLEENLPNEVFHPGLPATGPISIRWQGSFKAASAGTYAFQVNVDNGIKVWIDDHLVLSEWYQAWLPYAKQALVPLTAGTHRIRADWTRDANGRIFDLRWKPPVAERPITLWSEVGEGTDYTFVYGPDLDRVIAGYRQLTGKASLLPIWTLGLWQSRQRYETQQQSLDVVREFRKRRIPLDNIVQDWFYWRKAEWGSHQFDPERFPDPQGWVDAIHREHARIMISVWGKYYPGTKNYDEMHRRGFLYEPLLWEDVHEWVGFPYTNYDAFNPEARKLFWEQVRDALFTKKFDAWWMDATEPDMSSPFDLTKQKLRLNPTALGAGSRVLNAYALMNSRGVYEGQRGTAPDQRVFILTRSGYAGLQRYSSATWSGDMPCTWESLRRQIAAGLGYSISGVPYWSMDIGGFTAPPRFLGDKLSGRALDEWCELNARWFEFGSFVPLVRLHGESQLREPWAFGGNGHPAFKTIVKYDHLRYQLLPYVYSLAGAVTQDDGTFMRPLGMDFPADATARSCNDEYLFGPALLVAPVTKYQARERTVYFPATAGGWYNFWNGESAAEPGNRKVDAPYDRIPLFVRAGSIVPFGPDLQYTTEKPADPVTLYIYAGANGHFSIYEDDGLTYGYEHGAFARIPLQWNDAARTLTIGARQGSFPGMLTTRTFRTVLVSKDHRRGYDATATADQTVTYNGNALNVVLK